METELLKLKKLPSLQIISRNNSSSVRDNNSDVDINDDLTYTSLKDIIVNSPLTSHASSYEGNYDFDSSNIAIRNHLVKRAASAYVQSAAIVAARNPNYFIDRVWGRIRSRVSINAASCWNVYVRNPLHACFNPIYRFLAYTVGAVWNSVTRIS